MYTLRHPQNSHPSVSSGCVCVCVCECVCVCVCVKRARPAPPPPSPRPNRITLQKTGRVAVLTNPV